MDEKLKFLGTGWSFPPEFNKSEKLLLLTSAEEDIKRSLEIILGTRRGERVMRPEFGCNLDEMNFETFNLSTKTLMKDRIEKAFIFYEPRIQLLEVNIDETFINEGRVDIKIDYLIRSTNSRNNLVYPYYINHN